MDYDGPERRTNWVTKEEFQSLVTEVRQLSADWKRYLTMYDEFLRQGVEERTSRQELRKAVTEKLVAGGIWAFCIFLALSVWDYIKTHVK